MSSQDNESLPFVPIQHKCKNTKCRPPISPPSSNLVLNLHRKIEREIAQLKARTAFMEQSGTPKFG